MDKPDSVGTNFNQITRVQSDNNVINRSASNQGLKDQGNNSIGGGDNSVTKPQSKKPKNTALKQQRLPAWQPILTAKTVLPLFFAIGVIFVVLGGVLLHYSNLVNELVYDYTDCTTVEGIKCSTYNYTQACTCNIQLNITTEFTAPVYLYYGLKNFYQNHRRYVKSRDDNQLLGNAITSVSSDCSPYDKTTDASGAQLIYAPCGAIANSLFNDTLKLKLVSDGQNLIDVPVLATGIAWDTDKSVKFNNPASWANTIMPKNWQRAVYNLSDDPTNNGYKNEDLIVWMRTAALPNFRKLYRRVMHSSGTKFSSGLPVGQYNLEVNYRFPVVGFGGRKTFVISTATWIGGKNPFLGIAYLVVGSLCICLGFIFLVIHFKFSRNSKSNEDIVAMSNSKPNVATIETSDRN